MSTISERVRKYCEKHTVPKQELCPRIVQYWGSSKGNVFWDSLTGKRTMQNPVDRYSPCKVSVRKAYYGMYVCYIPQLKALEISGVTLEGNRGVDGVKKKWTYGKEYGYTSRYFIFNGTTTCYDSYGHEYTTAKRYENEVICDHLHELISSSNSNPAIVNELEKFINNKFSVDERRYFSYPWRVMDWYKRSFIQRKPSSKAFLLDYELDDEEINFDDVEAREVATFNKIDDKYGVIRVYENDNYYYRNSEIPVWLEKARVYISDKGKVNTCVNRNGKWNFNQRLWTFSSKLELQNKEKFLEWKPLKYIMPCFDENITIDHMLDVLRHPIIEQIIKAGYKNIGKAIMDSDGVPSALKNLFGIEKERKLPLYKLLGVNKAELEYQEAFYGINSYRWNTRSFIRSLKALYGRNDISDLSKETLEILYNVFKVDEYFSILTGSYYHSWGRLATTHNYTENDIRTLIRLGKLEEKHDGIVELYKDVMQTYSYINNKPDIEISQFENYEDLQRIHNALVEIKVREDAERRAYFNASEREKQEMLKKEFEKRQEERIKKYECIGDKFSVKVPRELDEITAEGIKLSHCVGGYVERHARGTTNILFLRRNEDIENSFYTIEIRGNDVIQIHGNHNRWLGNNPEAVPFMYKYLCDLGVNFNKKMLLNKGMGYGAGKEELPDTALYQAA